MPSESSGPLIGVHVKVHFKNTADKEEISRILTFDGDLDGRNVLGWPILQSVRL
jgi:hypothetical protein